jgi:hypothetical protein
MNATNGSIEINPRYAQMVQQSASSLGQLLIWTVYAHPSDYPDWFVARPTIIRPKTSGPMPMHLMAKDLETLRAMLPEGLTRLDRNDADDPTIIEVWV